MQQREKPMKLVRVLTLVAAMGIVCGLPKPAEASEGFSFGYYGPGYDFFPGHYPRHIFYPHIYRPYHYYWYGPQHQASQKAPRKSKAGKSCSRWNRACTTNWGRGNANYRGCMRYHGCG